MRDLFTRSIPATLTGFFSLVFRVIVGAIILLVALWLIGILLGILGILLSVSLIIPAIIIHLIWIAFAIWAVILLISFLFSLF